MKKILIIILAALQALLWATGCVKGARSPEALRLAEERMDNAPDSAYKLLRDVDQAELLTKEDSALYHLLLTQAKYKCYEDIKADSMINFAADYFTSSKDMRHAMLATYYSGIRYFDRGDYASAIKYFLRAEEMAKKLNDYHYIGLIDGSISQIYKKIYNFPLQLAYMQNSHKAHCESKQEMHIISSLSYLILAYYDDKQRQKALEMADSALTLEAVNRYPAYRLNIEYMKGYAQYSLHDYQGAIITLQKVSEEMGEVPAQLYRNIGMAYYSIGDTVKAQEWLSKIDPTKGDENFIPWEVYADRGDYREAFNSLRAEYRDVDRRVSTILRDNVSRAVAEFGEASVSEAKARAEAEGRQKRVITWTLAGALLLTAGGFIVYRRRKTARLREVMAMVDEQHLNVDQTSGTTASDTNIEELFMRYKQRFGSINSLCDNYFSAMGNERKQKAALDAMSRALSDFRRDKGTLHELEECFNRCTDNLMARFREDFPDMTDADSLLMLLLFTGFSTSAICVMLGVKLQTLYNRKSVLRKIIEQSTSPLRDKYLSFCRSGK